MKFFLVLALVFFFSQGTVTQRPEECAGRAAPFACKCDLMSSPINDPETAEETMNLDPPISREEFAPRVAGRHRRTHKAFLDYCTDQCLNRLRAKLHQANTRVADEKAETSRLIQLDGWNTLCDLLFNPGDEITNNATLVEGTEDVTYYWLQVSRRQACLEPRLSSLGSGSCACFNFPNLGFQKCFASAAIAGYTEGMGALTELF